MKLKASDGRRKCLPVVGFSCLEFGKRAVFMKESESAHGEKLLGHM